MFSRSLFVRGSFVFLKEVVCSYLSSSISFSFFTSSSCVSSSTILPIVLYFGNFCVFSIFTFAAFSCISFLDQLFLPMPGNFPSVQAITYSWVSNDRLRPLINFQKIFSSLSSFQPPSHPLPHPFIIFLDFNFEHPNF